MPNPNRGKVWIVDLGLVGKVRPCVILSIPLDPQDRVLMTVIPHTTSVHGTRHEVAVQARYLKAGAFDVQQVLTVPRVKLVRKLSELATSDFELVGAAVRNWLGL